MPEPMWCPQHKGQSQVRISRRIKDDIFYARENSTTLVVEATDEYWDEQGQIHSHYTYLCSKRHEFILPCNVVACTWGKEQVATSMPPIESPAPPPPKLPALPWNGQAALPPAPPPPKLPGVTDGQVQFIS